MTPYLIMWEGIVITEKTGKKTESAIYTSIPNILTHFWKRFDCYSLNQTLTLAFFSAMRLKAFKCLKVACLTASVCSGSESPGLTCGWKPSLSATYSTVRTCCRGSTYENAPRTTPLPSDDSWWTRSTWPANRPALYSNEYGLGGGGCVDVVGSS